MSDSHEQTGLRRLFHTGLPHFVALHRYCIFFLPQTEVLWQLSVKKVGPVFQLSNSICALHVSVKHFGSSHNISNPPPSKSLQLAEGSNDDYHFLAIRFFLSLFFF